MVKLENWKKIDSNFSNYTAEQWEKKGFELEEVGDWINAGIRTFESSIARWLKEEKNYTASQVRDFGDIEKLKEEYEEWETEAEVKSKEYQVSESEWADYLTELRKLTASNARVEIKRKFFITKAIELFNSKIATSPNQELLTALINIEANYNSLNKTYDEREDYWQVWLEEGNFSSLDSAEIVINKLLEKYEDEKALEEEAARQYYEVLELTDRATPREIKEKYHRLSLLYHPDKQRGKSKIEKEQAAKKIAALTAAYDILGDESKKKKYDLCLMKRVEDFEDIWLNRKREVKYKKSETRVDDYFGKQVASVLQDELDQNELNEETIDMFFRGDWKDETYADIHKKEDGLNTYDPELAKKAQEAYNELSEPGVGILKPEEFCSRKIFGELQYRAIEDARKYLDIINHAIQQRNSLKKNLDKELRRGEGILAGRFARNELNEEELADLGEYNNLKSCQRKYRELEFKFKLKVADEKFKNSAEFISWTGEKMEKIKKAKDKLLAELEEKIVYGEKLLDFEEIRTFATEFEDFKVSLNEMESKEVEVESYIKDGEEEDGYSSYSDEEEREEAKKNYERRHGKKKMKAKWKTITEIVVVNQAVTRRILEQKGEEIMALEVKLHEQLAKEGKKKGWRKFYQWLQKEIIISDGLKAKIKPEKQDQYKISSPALTDFCDSLEATLDHKSDFHLFPEFQEEKTFAELFPYENTYFGKKFNLVNPSREDYDQLIKLFNQFSKKIKQESQVLESQPISEPDKKEMIKYLDDLVLKSVIEKIKRKGLKTAQNTVFAGEETDYSAKINNADNKKIAENVRSKTVASVFYYVDNLKGGSGEKEEAKKILSDFALILRKEIEEELGVKLSAKQQEQLEIDWEVEINNSARKLTESKWKILDEAILKKSEAESQESEEKEYLLCWEGTEEIEGMKYEKFAVIKGGEEKELKFYSTFFSISDEGGFYNYLANKKLQIGATYQLSTPGNFVRDSEAYDRIIQGIDNGGYEFKKLDTAESPSHDNLDQEKEREQLETIEKLNREKEEIGKKEQELQQELFQLREAQQEKTEKEQEIKQKIQQLEQKLVLENGKIKEIQQKISELELEIKDNQVKKLEEQIKGLESTKNNKETKLKEWETNFDLLKNEVRGINKDLKKQREINQQAEIEKQRLEGELKQLTEKEAELRELEKKLTEKEILVIDPQELEKLEKKISENENKFQILQQEKQELEKIKTEREEKLKEVEEQIGLAKEKKRLEAEQKENERKEAEKKRQKEEGKIQAVCDKAVEFIDDYWTGEISDVNGTIDGKTKEEVLTTGWQNDIKILDTEGKIETKKNELKELIDNAKKSEKDKQKTIWQNKSIEEVKDYWKSKAKKKDSEWKINKQTITQVLGENWENDIRKEDTEIAIENQKKVFIEKIDRAKLTKTRKGKKENYLGEEKLNEDMKKLWKGERTYASKKLVSFPPILGGLEEDIKIWFGELRKFLDDNKKFLETVIDGEMSTDEKKKIFSELEKNSPIKNGEEFKESVYDKKEIRQYFLKMVEVIRENQERIAKEQAEIAKSNQIKNDIEQETNLEDLKERTGSRLYDRIKNINYRILSDNREEIKLLEKLRNRYQEVSTEINEWENMKSSILAKTNLVGLEDGKEWDGKIKTLVDTKLPAGRRQEDLKNILQNQRWEIKEVTKKWNKLELDIKSENNHEKLAEGNFWDEEIKKLSNHRLSTGEKTNLVQNLRKSRYQKLWQELVKKQEEMAKWEEIKKGIKNEKNINLLTEESSWYEQIEDLDSNYLAVDKKSYLQTYRKNCRDNLEKIIQAKLVQWDQMKADIKKETNPTHLGDGEKWDKQINDLNSDYLGGDRTLSKLQVERKNRRDELEKIAELKKAKGDKFNSLAKSVKVIESMLKVPQKELRDTLSELQEIIDKLPAEEKEDDENLTISSFTNLLGKLEDVKEAIQNAEKSINKCLKEKQLSVEQFQNKISVIKNKVSSEEVAKYTKQLLLEIKQHIGTKQLSVPEEKSNSTWIIVETIFGIIIVSVVACLISKGKKEKKKKKKKQNK
ncbi:MAG: DnaJ domain-containing protein [Candidatus Moeniiplasma glomeromycotorum]|nr:DnaJ domain-containing protein [Candidatus Moeniiplasma glomeromycotorum]